MIVLSATSYGNDSEGLEGEVMTAMGFKVFKNQMFKAERGDKLMVWDPIDLPTDEAKSNFINE